MRSGDKPKRGISRRDFVKGAAAGAAVAAAGGGLAAAARGAGTVDQTAAVEHAEAKHGKPKGEADLALVNGKILTLDDANTVAESVTIRDGRIEALFDRRGVGAAAQTIDLKGATVIPALVDSHVHFLRCGINPGHEVRIIETATSISELQQLIAERAKTVPAGEFITCIGGWNRNGLAEKRLPTQAELDAAAPANPVYLSQTGGGAPGGVTNTSGAQFFASKGVAVGAGGTIASTGGAQAALVSVQTEDDKRRGTAEVMDFAASIGLTTVSDQGGISNVGLGAFTYAVELWRAGNLKVRQRPFFWSGDDPSPTAEVMRGRIANNINQLGDDFWKFVGVGERIGGGSVDFAGAAQFVAEHGWTLTQHSLSAAENNQHLAAYQAAAAIAPIGELRWSLAHVNAITDANIQLVKQLGITLNVQGWQYTGAAAGTPAGPPWRKLLGAGIPLGGGTDATNVAALNPWLMLYYMTTGKNNAGEQTNASDQSLTRLEALGLYSKGSAYLLFEDENLGTIEPGKLADLVVLSDDPLKVSDDKLRKISSNLTLVGGGVTHASGPFATVTIG
jgi:predicted amidohydrolase YtcJ